MARSNKSEDFGSSGFSQMKDFGFSGSIDVPMKGRGPHMSPPSPMPSADYSKTITSVRRDNSGKETSTGGNNTTYGRSKPISREEFDSDGSFTQGGTNPLSHAQIDGFMNNSAPKGGAPAGGGYAEGGQVNIHPHGQDLHHVDSEMDGGVTHHHSHGGYTTFHTDGNITHHTADGQEAMPNAPTPYADGGSVNAHPHGHSVTHTERMADREVHRHSHGGFTVHYDDGRAPTHHGKDGVPAYHTGGTAGEYAKGGHADEKQDRTLIKKMMAEEDKGEGMARGGHVKRHPHHKMPTPAEPMPMGRAAAPKPAPMQGGMPINRPPRNPQRSPSPRNEMPGGVMPYGVQPSAEPDISTGSVGNAPGVPIGAGMKRGGKMKA